MTISDCHHITLLFNTLHLTNGERAVVDDNIRLSSHHTFVQHTTSDERAEDSRKSTKADWHQQIGLLLDKAIP